MSLSRKLSEWVPVSQLFLSRNNINFCHDYYFADNNYDDNDDNNKAHNNQNNDYDNAVCSEQNSSSFE